ncbi:MAG: UDP-N-acetylmuramoyl-tripeptide--D-alanyl-D-alanine ligase, partial [Gammaproteobacteria bacterium]
MARTLASVAEHVHGRLRGPDCRFNDVSTDTRQNVRGSLFVALRGENFDGNDYIAAAASGGAAGALVSRPADVALSQVEVEDTRLAFGDMARAWRENFAVPVVAVTGSAGKTTVRALIASILSVDRQICTTEGNLNNDIGVPLTLMRMRRGDAAAVIELGANHAGEIDYLARIARPDVGLITNAGRAHLEGFGSLDGVAAAKGELLDHISDNGTAVLNADDEYFQQWCERASPARVMSFGFVFSSDCHTVNEIETYAGGSRFTIHLPDGSHVPVSLALPGRHNVRNALAAATCAFVLGVSSEQIAYGLGAARTVRGRLRERMGIAGARIIDDSYNANPASARAALDYLAEFDGQRVFVLGDMGELGTEAVSLHREVGEYARPRCDRFIAIGGLAAEAASAFGEGAEIFADVAAVERGLSGDLDAHTTVLIKASRAMRLERLAAALTAQQEGPS